MNRVTVEIYLENLGSSSLTFALFPFSSDTAGGSLTSVLGFTGVKYFAVPSVGSGKNIVTRRFSFNALELYKMKT